MIVGILVKSCLIEVEEGFTYARNSSEEGFTYADFVSFIINQSTVVVFLS